MYFSKTELYERGKYGAPKLNVFMFWYPVVNPKSGPDYSVFIRK
jgi:hypothetical protein